MFTLNLDLSGFEQAARDMGALVDQVPFAVANAMNTAAFKTKDYLAGETWPAHVSVKNQRFMRAALNVRKATKRNLSISIFDRLNRGSLSQHESGGAKLSRGQLAIPDTANVQGARTGKGVPQRLRPRNVPNSFKAPGKKGGELIFQRYGSYQKSGSRKKAGTDDRHKRLMYVLRPSAQIKPAVPFHEDFQREFVAQMQQAFPAAMRNAMKTRGLKGRYERQAALGRRSSGSGHGNAGPRG